MPSSLLPKYCLYPSTSLHFTAASLVEATLMSLVMTAGLSTLSCAFWQPITSTAHDNQSENKTKQKSKSDHTIPLLKKNCISFKRKKQISNRNYITGHGSTPKTHLLTFPSYSIHPRLTIFLSVSLTFEDLVFLRALTVAIPQSGIIFPQMLSLLIQLIDRSD